MQFQTHNCDRCGEEFIVACLSELEEKLRKHVCPKVNRHIERTEEHKRQIRAQFVFDTTVNRIEDSNRKKLVQQGMLRQC